MQNAVTLTDAAHSIDSSARIRAEIKMAYNRGKCVGVALSCTFYNDFLVKGTAPAKKKLICAEMKINT